MRIEINAGGLVGLSSVNEYGSSFDSLVSSVDSVISSFKTVKRETENISGGATGQLAVAKENIYSVIKQQTEKLEKAREVKAATIDFIDNTVKKDLEVSALVKKNQEAFYNVNPWLRPPAPAEQEKKKSYVAQAWNWVCGKVEAGVDATKEFVSNAWNDTKSFVKGSWEGLKEFASESWEGLKDFASETWENLKEFASEAWEGIKDFAADTWEAIKDTAKKAWDGIVEFYNEHKVAIAAVVLVVAVVLCFIPGTQGLGALMLKGAITGMVMGGLIGGVSGGLQAKANGGSFWEGAAEGAVDGAAGGAIAGAAFGALGAAGGALGSGIQASSTAGKVITTVFHASTMVSMGMSAFDIAALADLAIDPDNNPIYDLNQEAHSNPVYNTIQIGAGVTATVTGGMVSTMQTEYIDTPPSEASQNVVEVDGFEAVEQENGQYIVKSDHYDAYQDHQANWDKYELTSYDSSKVEMVNSRDIEGIHLNASETTSEGMWSWKGNDKAYYEEYFTSGGGKGGEAIGVYRVNTESGTYYEFAGNGRHRILMGQQMDQPVEVHVYGEYNLKK